MIDLLIVTGGTKGIGNAIAKNCTSVAKLVLAIGSTKNTIFNPIESTWINLRLDLLDLDKVQSSILNTLGYKKFNKVGVILCASQLGTPGGIFDANIEAWENLYKINVLGNLLVLRSAIASMSENGSLRAIFFAGGGAAYAYPEFSGYSLTKVATVRAVENIGQEFDVMGLDASIIALAPGAIATQMLEKVMASGGSVKTRTDISEPVNFARRFILNQMPSREMNGRFIHVRDNLARITNSNHQSHQFFKLRRIE